MTVTFPDINPIFPLDKSTESIAQSSSMGDGYEKSIAFGLNHHRPQWRLTWNVRKVDADIIEDFLSLRAADGDSFYWGPPEYWATGTNGLSNVSTNQRWRCATWERKQLAADWYEIAATFQQVYEPASIALPSFASFYADDTLCETDWGTNETDIWVSRISEPIVTDTNTSYDPTTNIVVDSTGNSYQVFRLLNSSTPTALYITKRNPTGAVVWNKKLNSSLQQGLEIERVGLQLRLVEPEGYVALGGQISGANTVFAVEIVKIDFSGNLLSAKTYTVPEDNQGKPQGYFMGLDYLPYSRTLVFFIRSAVGQYYVPVDIVPITAHYYRINGQAYASDWLPWFMGMKEFSDFSKIVVVAHDRDLSSVKTSLVKVGTDFVPHGSVKRITSSRCNVGLGDLIFQHPSGSGYVIFSGLDSSGPGSPSACVLDTDLNVVERFLLPIARGVSAAIYTGNSWLLLCRQGSTSTLNIPIPGNYIGPSVLEVSADLTQVIDEVRFTFGIPFDQDNNSRKLIHGLSLQRNRAIFSWGRNTVRNASGVAELSLPNIFAAGVRLKADGAATLQTGPYTAACSAGLVSPPTLTAASSAIFTTDSLWITTTYSVAEFSSSVTLENATSITWDLYVKNFI